MYVGLSRLSIYWVCLLLLLTHHSHPGDWDAHHLKARMNGTSHLYVVIRNIHFTTFSLQQQSFLEPRNCPKGARFAIVRSKQISSRETEYFHLRPASPRSHWCQWGVYPSWAAVNRSTDQGWERPPWSLHRSFLEMLACCHLKRQTLNAAWASNSVVSKLGQILGKIIYDYICKTVFT